MVRLPSVTSSDEVMRVSGSFRRLARSVHDCKVAGCAAVSWGNAAWAGAAMASRLSAMPDRARVPPTALRLEDVAAGWPGKGNEGDKGVR